MKSTIKKYYRKTRYKIKQFKWSDIKRAIYFIGQKIGRKIRKLSRILTRKPNYYQVNFVPKCQWHILLFLKKSLNRHWGLYEPTLHQAQISVMNRSNHFPYKWNKEKRKIVSEYTEKCLDNFLTDVILTDLHEFLHYFYEEHEIFVLNEEWVAHIISEQLLYAMIKDAFLLFDTKENWLFSNRFDGGIVIRDSYGETVWLEKPQIERLKSIINERNKKKYLQFNFGTEYRSYDPIELLHIGRSG